MATVLHGAALRGGDDTGRNRHSYDEGDCSKLGFRGRWGEIGQGPKRA